MLQSDFEVMGFESGLDGEKMVTRVGFAFGDDVRQDFGVPLQVHVVCC